MEQGKKIALTLAIVLAIASPGMAVQQLSVNNLTLAPSATDTLVVSGNVDVPTAGATIIVVLSPQGGNTGTVTFTPGAVDIVQLGHPWSTQGPLTRLDADDLGFPTENYYADINGSGANQAVVYNGPLAGFPVVASSDATGVWDVSLSSVNFSLDSTWDANPPIVTTRISGTITVMAATCPGPGDGDVNGDTFVDGLDVFFFVDQMITPAGAPDPAYCAADIDGDNDIDVVDLDQFVEVVLERPFGACCQTDGSCLQEVPSNCFGEGVVFNGIGATCGAVSCPVRPVNDTCANATAIATQGVFAFDTTDAATSEPTIIAADVYYCWTAPCSGAVRVETCGLTSNDSKILVYNNCACPPSLGSIVASLSQACGPQSRVEFTATAAQSYLIRLGSKPGMPGGPGSLSITCLGPPGADACALAPVIFGDGVYYFDNRTATTDGPIEPGACAKSGHNQIENDVWFCWTADCNATVTAETCGTLLDTKLAVYAGCVCPPGPSLACDDDALFDCGLQSRIMFSAVGGNTYLIRVGSFNPAQSGIGPLRIVSAPACP